MDFRKIAFASLIYMIWSVLIGFFVPVLATWSAIIAAIVAGIYIGHGSKASEGITGGVLAGLIGGIISGVIVLYTPSIAGIPLRVSSSNFLNPALNLIETNVPWFSNAALSVVGMIFAGIGGLLGSREKLGRVLLFFALFTLFIFYGAIDNMVWNWGRSDWSWNMSISHVLTNRIDLFVAVVFAIFITIVSYLLKVY
jgi:hypothetical protein